MRALLLVLCLAGLAFADADDLRQPNSVVLKNAGSLLGRFPVIDFASGDLVATDSGSGVGLLSLGTNASEFGTCTGDTAAENCNPDHFPGSIDGGATSSDALEIDPNSAATWGSNLKGVTICNNAVDVGNSGVPACVVVLNANISMGGSSGYDFVRLGSTNTITQTSNGLIAGTFPLVNGFGGSVTIQVTDDAINGSNLGRFNQFAPVVVIKNATNDAYSGQAVYGYAPAFQWSKTGSGTLGIATVRGVAPDIQAPASGITLSDVIVIGGPEPSGSLSGTLTKIAYFKAPALTKGTTRAQFAADETTVAGSPASGEGWFNVEAGAPNRGCFINESGHKWCFGYQTTVIKGTSVAGSTVFSAPGSMAGTTTESANQAPIPGSLKIHALACGTNAAQGAGPKTLVITVRSGTNGSMSDTAATLTFSNSNTPTTFRSEAGVAIATASGKLWDVGAALTSAGTTSDYWCSITWSLDAW